NGSDAAAVLFPDRSSGTDCPAARLARARAGRQRRYGGANLGIGRRPICLSVEPDVLEPPFVVDAVYHSGPSLEPRLPAARAGGVEEHRPEHGFGQFALGLPDDLLALLRVGFHRLPVDELVEFGIAVAGIVARRPGV